MERGLPSAATQQTRVSTMGHKHSKRPKKPKTQPEVTEIIELNDNQSELDDVHFDIVEVAAAAPPPAVPQALSKILDSVDLIERTVETMTPSQLDLYYATLKDDLHNQWQKLYDFSDFGDAAVRKVKVAAIERVKAALKRLNGRVLMNSVHGQ